MSASTTPKAVTQNLAVGNAEVFDAVPLFLFEIHTWRIIHHVELDC